jgi:hypothetical protein
MVMEVLDESQPWPIDIEPPEEPPRTRHIVAFKGGEAVGRWRWRDNAWYNPGSFDRDWRSIVQSGIRNRWTLQSVRVVDPLDAGTAEMVRKQIATHITLPAFVAESCQFDGLTDGGKDEWRAIFTAALDAYLAAGGKA